MRKKNQLNLAYGSKEEKEVQSDLENDGMIKRNKEVEEKGFSRKIMKLMFRHIEISGILSKMTNRESCLRMKSQL